MALRLLYGFSNIGNNLMLGKNELGKINEVKG